MLPSRSISVKTLGMCSQSSWQRSERQCFCPSQGFRMRAVDAALASAGAFASARSWEREARTTSNSRKVVPMAFSRPSIVCAIRCSMAVLRASKFRRASKAVWSGLGASVWPPVPGLDRNESLACEPSSRALRLDACKKAGRAEACHAMWLSTRAMSYGH